jgi:hypothetical protein
MKINPNNFEKIYKGVISNLMTIGVISQSLPNREQERIERISTAEMERAERMRDKNNRRSSLRKS